MKRVALFVGPLMIATASVAVRASAHPSTLPALPPTIVLNHSIGGVAFLDRKSEVERRLGKGDLVPLIPGAFYVAYPRYGIKILYARFKGTWVVQGIETTSTRYRTVQGVGVGSSVRAVKALPGRMFCEPGHCTHLGKTSTAPSTAFEFNAKGLVKWISVGSGVLPHG